MRGPGFSFCIDAANFEAVCSFPVRGSGKLAKAGDGQIIYSWYTIGTGLKNETRNQPTMKAANRSTSRVAKQG